MAAQPPIPPPSTPHILRIPGEIRNQIYEHLLLFSHPVRIHRNPQTNKPNKPNPASSLASTLLPLFLTSRQFHLEASALFYARNQFTPRRDAPQQAQANLLFRVFLDRLGPRNAALLRHLALPFPLDPEELFRGRFYNTSGIGRDEEDDSGCCRSLVPRLGERCPGLETVEFDLGGDEHWLRELSPNTATMRGLFGAVEEALWRAFPGLRYIDLRLASGMVRKRRGVGDWEVVTAPRWGKEKYRDDDCPWVSVARLEPAWHPDDARSPDYLLYAPPEQALRSEILDDWTTRHLAEVYVRFAMAWMRSPTRAMREWEDARDWREWRRTMIAQAGPVGAPLYCFGTGSVSAMPARPKRGVLGFLASRR